MVKIYAALVVGCIDLPSINYWRIKLVEQKRDGKALRVPQNFQRAIRSEVHGVIDEQTAVHHRRVSITVGYGATRIAGSGSAPLLDPEQNPPGIPPGGVSRTFALAYS